MISVTVLAKIKNGLLYSEGFSEILLNMSDGRYTLTLHPTENKGSLSQLAKIHADIRLIAKELGYTFGEFKRLTKAETGFLMETAPEEVVEISFGTGTKEQLDMVINFLEVTASQNNITLP
jgi:hypothetical protein